MKKKVTYKLEQTKSIIVEVETAEQEQKIKELNRDFERIDRQNRRIAAKTDSLERMYEETGYEVIDDGANPEEQYEQKELKNTIVKAMEGLTEKQKLVVYKTFWEQKTLREIGKELGVSYVTAFEILETAKKKLKKFLKNF